MQERSLLSVLLQWQHSVHVPQHAWDFLTPAARKLCEVNRRLIFLDARCARCALREYRALDVVVIRGGFDACFGALPSHLFRGVDLDRRLEPYCLYLKDRRHLDWAAGLDDEERGEEIRRMHRLPVDVTPNVYLGDAGCAARPAPSPRSGVSSTSTSSSVTCSASAYGSRKICLTVPGLASASKSGRV